MKGRSNGEAKDEMSANRASSKLNIPRRASNIHMTTSKSRKNLGHYTYVTPERKEELFQEFSD
jgi:hypothetical protein